MNNLPWFPFWVDDFLGSRRVKLMSLEAVGLYTLLLGEQWKDGPLPDDLGQIATLCGRHGSDIANAWREVRPCFTETPAGLVNERLEKEREKQEAKRERKARAGRKGAEARWSQQDNSSANSSANATAMRDQCQPEPEPEVETETTTTVHEGTDTFPVKPKKDASGQYQYPEAFERAWAAYPTRDGSNPKVGAYKAFRARVASGDDPEDLIRSATHYRKHLQAKQREGTEFVKQAATFWGPSEPWREFIEPMAKNGKHTPADQTSDPRDHFFMRLKRGEISDA